MHLSNPQLASVLGSTLVNKKGNKVGVALQNLHAACESCLQLELQPHCHDLAACKRQSRSKYDRQKPC